MAAPLPLIDIHQVATQSLYIYVECSRSHGLYRRGRSVEAWRTIPTNMAEETSQVVSEPARVLSKEPRRPDSEGQGS